MFYHYYFWDVDLRQCDRKIKWIVAKDKIFILLRVLFESNKTMVV